MTVHVIGGGLAGSEAAWQIARRGGKVCLWEMRPGTRTPAHQTGELAELVCSNSLGSLCPDRASGILHAELERLGSLLRGCASECAVPAGGALAVDRTFFSRRVSAELAAHPNIRIERAEVKRLPPEGIVIVASGPLTSSALSRDLVERGVGGDLYFYDAIAPVVRADSLNVSRMFRASRHGRGTREEGDYLNGPFDRESYCAFVQALCAAERQPLRSFEADIGKGVRAGEGPHFERCLPIEVLAGRGEKTLAFGPLRPVGLSDPHTGRRPYAVVQLRQEDRAGHYYSLVGFQTNLRPREQERVFRLIPGLERAEFTRFGQMHRNTFLNGPRVLHPTLQWRGGARVFFAGQLAGFEGYAGSMATGLIAGWNAFRLASAEPLLAPPPETMMGGLLNAVSAGNPERFQPVKAALGLLPPVLVRDRGGKRDRAIAHARRARDAMEAWLASVGLPGV